MGASFCRTVEQHLYQHRDKENKMCNDNRRCIHITPEMRKAEEAKGIFRSEEGITFVAATPAQAKIKASRHGHGNILKGLNEQEVTELLATMRAAVTDKNYGPSPAWIHPQEPRKNKVVVPSIAETLAKLN
jgi:hypothetical protein